MGGNAEGLGVAVTAHRTGDGATVVLVDVDPQAADIVTATSVDRSALRLMRGPLVSREMHEPGQVSTESRRRVDGQAVTAEV
jgi:hypothetical protein